MSKLPKRPGVIYCSTLVKIEFISKLWGKLFNYIVFFLTLCHTSFTKSMQMNDEKKPMLKVRQKALEVATVFSSCV